MSSDVSQVRVASTSVAPPNHSSKARFASASKDDYQEQRNKILTMKYGKQQMHLIRKRIRVEMWLMESLEVLFGSDQGTYQTDVDIDELLDLETDKQRILWMRDYLTSAQCSAPQDKIDEFVEELVGQLRTL